MEAWQAIGRGARLKIPVTVSEREGMSVAWAEYADKCHGRERGERDIALRPALREVVYKGRVMLAIERYKKGQASLGKAAELAGMPIGQMITLLAEYGVPSNLEEEDYARGLEHLRKAW